MLRCNNMPILSSAPIVATMYSNNGFNCCTSGSNNNWFLLLQCCVAAITTGHVDCLVPKDATGRHGMAHKVFFAYARVWRALKKSTCDIKIRISFLSYHKIWQLCDAPMYYCYIQIVGRPKSNVSFKHSKFKQRSHKYLSSA